jgi:hypothetical protein
MIGTVRTERWRAVAADVDGVPQPELIGKVTERRTAQFAYRAEGEQWANDQAAEGFELAWFASAAVSYYGPTDAPGNCWSVTMERPAEDLPSGTCGQHGGRDLAACDHSDKR